MKTSICEITGLVSVMLPSGARYSTRFQPEFDNDATAEFGISFTALLFREEDDMVVGEVRWEVTDPQAEEQENMVRDWTVFTVKI